MYFESDDILDNKFLGVSQNPIDEKIKKLLEDNTPSFPTITIRTDGLEEEIRCLMCKNIMRSDSNCDGGCEYDKEVYDKIIKMIMFRTVAITILK